MTDGFQIRVETDDADRVIRRLAVGLSDLRPFWPRLTRLFIGWMRLQFESEGAFWNLGTRWTPLSPAYAERKARIWGPKPILQASGQARRAASMPKRIVGPRTLRLIIDDAGPEHGPVLQYHLEGGANLPRRPVVGPTLPPLAALELGREAEGYVRDLLRGIR